MLVFGEEEETDFAASAEFGIYARYKIGPRARLRAGYEIMALADIFDAESNYRPVVLPGDGQRYEDGSAIFHGAVLGIEIFR